MAFRNPKVARLAAGAAIVGAAGITGAVAVAQTGPAGVHYGDEAGQYGTAGNAYGHRLHCPSYRGMERSKGHATCHEAPRAASDEERQDQDESKAPEQTAQVVDLEATKQATTSTERRSDLDDHGTTTTTAIKALQATQPPATQPGPDQQNCDHDKTGANDTSSATTTPSPSPSPTQAQTADRADDTRTEPTGWQSSDDHHRDARTGASHRDGDRHDGGEGWGRH